MSPTTTYGPALSVGIGSRHVRLCRAHVDALFGEGYALTPITTLLQPQEKACMETLCVRGPDGELDKVRLVMPCTEKTAVELSLQDMKILGLSRNEDAASASDSTLGCTLMGPKGTIVLAAGVFARPRTLLLPPAIANELSLQAGHEARVQVMGERSRVFSDVRVQVCENARPELRVSLEDANTLEVGPDLHAYVLSSSEGEA
jgi:propanediol utilization protein